MFNPKDLKIKRSELKNNLTQYELLFKNRLNEYKNNLAAKTAKYLNFKEQEIIGFYITDFCFPTKKLIIEIDGGIHNRQINYDLNRDIFLTKCGFTVFRILNEDVEKFDFNRIVKLPNYPIYKFKKAKNTANGHKGQAWRKALQFNPELKTQRRPEITI